MMDNFWYVQTLTFQLKEAKMYLETTVTVDTA